jgi:ubiquinone/menaquinone biosynthesis C-methylase UbiE
MNSEYYQTRYSFSPERSKVWRAICGYLQKYVNASQDSVLDLGCGYCDFINNIKAYRKFAIDISSASQFYANQDVSFYNSSIIDLNMIEDQSINVVFASNLLEHLDDDEIAKAMTEIIRILQPKGKVIILQPNFKYSFREYFDDYTHKKIFTHISLSDLLESYKLNSIIVCPKFLPLTLKSRLPKSYWLTKLYLNLPVKPLAKQMLMIFQKD